MNRIDQVLYTARTHTTGGRDGASRSSDGRLDVQLSTPGGPGTGTNPEQLFAASWSACFIGAIRVVADSMKVALPATLAIDAEIDLGTSDDTYAIAGRLKVSVPGMDRALAQELVTAAHLTCPYSRATRGNIAVDVRVA